MRPGSRRSSARLAILGCLLAPLMLAAEEAPAVTTIGFGSCLHQDHPAPILTTIAAAAPDRFLFLGDNIYSDTTEPAVMRRNYAKLAAKPEFQELAAATTLLATWDDHDYGENNAGAAYPMRAEAEALFEDFWAPAADDPRRARDGVYSAHTFGEPGRRVQVLLLDTRFFRAPRAEGKRPEAEMLGAASYADIPPILDELARLKAAAEAGQSLSDA